MAKPKSSKSKNRRARRKSRGGVSQLSLAFPCADRTFREVIREDYESARGGAGGEAVIVPLNPGSVKKLGALEAVYYRPISVQVVAYPRSTTESIWLGLGNANEVDARRTTSFSEIASCFMGCAQRRRSNPGASLEIAWTLPRPTWCRTAEASPEYLAALFLGGVDVSSPPTNVTWRTRFTVAFTFEIIKRA